jgi:hypothetical protein
MAKTRDAAKGTKDTDVLERIAEAVEKLVGEVEILRAIIDRLQDDFAWALNNDAFRGSSLRCERSPPIHITSVPRDPLAPDWHERVNRFRPEDFDDEVHESQSDKEIDESVQRDLFSR